VNEIARIKAAIDGIVAAGEGELRRLPSGDQCLRLKDGKEFILAESGLRRTK